MAAGTAPSTMKQVKMSQVVMFGDSITQGSWVAGGTGAELAHKWQRKLDVVNRGLSAQWGLDIIKRWLPLAGDDSPPIKLLVIWFGANDAALPPSPQALTLKRFKDNLREIASVVTSPTSPYHSPHTQLLFLTPPPVDADTRNAELASRNPPRVPDRDAGRTREFAKGVEEVASDLAVPVVDTWTAIDAAAQENGLERYLSDGLHLTPEGYGVVTAEITKVLLEKLPHLHWDALEQTFPHWADWIPQGKRF
ncbi:hypothetical protein JCM11641_007072 [Rhodosporidiobolus odoratus]